MGVYIGVPTLKEITKRVTEARDKGHLVCSPVAIGLTFRRANRPLLIQQGRRLGFHLGLRFRV